MGITNRDRLSFWHGNHHVRAAPLIVTATVDKARVTAGFIVFPA
jgi:hypothetical protein